MPLVVPVLVTALRSLVFETVRETPVPRVVPVRVLPLLVPMLRLPELRETERVRRQRSSSARVQPGATGPPGTPSVHAYV